MVGLAVAARGGERAAQARRHRIHLCKGDYFALAPGRPLRVGRPRNFVVEEESTAGFPGLVNCLGIESPGLTAAPAIAERVVELLR